MDCTSIPISDIRRISCLWLYTFAEALPSNELLIRSPLSRLAGVTGNMCTFVNCEIVFNLIDDLYYSTCSFAVVKMTAPVRMILSYLAKV